MEWRKVPVGVYIATDKAGKQQPLTVVWEDGRKFPIESLIDVRLAASPRVGLMGTCYTVRIRGRRAYLFDDFGKWFMEGCDKGV